MKRNKFGMREGKCEFCKARRKLRMLALTYVCGKLTKIVRLKMVCNKCGHWFLDELEGYIEKNLGV